MSRRKRRAVSPEEPEVRVLRVLEKPLHGVRWVVEERRHVALERPEWPDPLEVRVERRLVVEPLAGRLPDELPLEAFPAPSDLEGLDFIPPLYERRGEPGRYRLPAALWQALPSSQRLRGIALQQFVFANELHDRWYVIGSAFSRLVRTLGPIMARLGYRSIFDSPEPAKNALHPATRIARIFETMDTIEELSGDVLRSSGLREKLPPLVRLVHLAIEIGYLGALLVWEQCYGEDALEGMRLARGRKASGGRPAPDKDLRLAEMRRLIENRHMSINAAARWVAANAGGTPEANRKLWREYRKAARSKERTDRVSL